MEVVITDMQAEVATLRQTQIDAADRFAAALTQSDEKIVEGLQDIARMLAAPPLEPEVGPHQ